MPRTYLGALLLFVRNLFMKMFLLGVLGLAVLVGAWHWFDAVDYQNKVDAVAYKDCVQSLYGMSPEKWRDVNGSYPECEN